MVLYNSSRRTNADLIMDDVGPNGLKVLVDCVYVGGEWGGGYVM